MVILTKESKDYQETEKVIIRINDTKFICKESFGNLQITRIYDGEYDNSTTDLINIQPRSGNQIDIY